MAFRRWGVGMTSSCTKTHCSTYVSTLYVHTPTLTIPLKTHGGQRGGQAAGRSWLESFCKSMGRPRRLYSPGRLPAGVRVGWVNPEWVHLSGSGRGKLPLGPVYIISLVPLLMDRCDDSRNNTRPKFLTVLVGPAGSRRGVNCLLLAGNPAHSILVTAAAALTALGVALGPFAGVGTGCPAGLGEGGNGLALSPRFGPKLLRHLSCPSSFTTPSERGEDAGAQGLDWLLLCMGPGPPPSTVCSSCVMGGSWKAKAPWGR